uniref:Cilia- and flagella-associated protein 126 n=1 Tax=Diabrotica virgifera virgifera TaxID=50390 RepID=A0A6P7F9U6_DIAVI
MSKLYRASQYDMAYMPTVLRNWEIPRYHCEIPGARLGKTQIIANKRGHILPGVPRPPPTPWGCYLGTWYLPKRITRQIANKLNGTDNRKHLIAECKKKLNQKPKMKLDHHYTKPEIEKHVGEIQVTEDQGEEPHAGAGEIQVERRLCPIHEMRVEYI